MGLKQATSQTLIRRSAAGDANLAAVPALNGVPSMRRIRKLPSDSSNTSRPIFATSTPSGVFACTPRVGRLVRTPGLARDGCSFDLSMNLSLPVNTRTSGKVAVPAVAGLRFAAI